MTYTDTLFIFVFALLWLTVRALRTSVVVREWLIIGFGLFLVSSWGLSSLFVLLTVAAFNFVFVWIVFLTKRPLGLAKWAIVFDLAVLAFFKYSGFIGANLAWFPAARISLPAFGIPLAISFYTFHIISYLVDFSRRATSPLPLRKYLFYLCFFPHLIAGPIVRTWQLAPQVGRVRRVPGDLAIGVHYLVLGFFLKAAIANNLAAAIDPIWEQGGELNVSTADYWLAAFLYYCQIYGDFAGYTLMALGMARLLGYRLPPNFRGPMLAGTMQGFWRRWHITLSFWLRDYLYIPLGGNQRGMLRGLANVLITMLLGGLWHGAGWTFVAWGGMHGIGICGERLLGIRADLLAGWRRAAWWAVTQFWVTIAWVFFRSPDLTGATNFFRAMFRFNHAGAWSVHGGLVLSLLFALGAVLHQTTPLWINRVPRKHLGVLLGAATGILLVLDIVVYSPSKTFIYFQF